MELKSLTVRDFRNLERIELELSPVATIFVGPNGQGKTNLLEAVYFLATLKPLRAAKLSELVRFGQCTASLRGRFALGGSVRDIGVELAVQERGPAIRHAFVDGKKATSLLDYFGGVSVVSFTPDDLAAIKGAPEGRRSLLDRAVFNRFPAFLPEARAYQRALRGRNRLLKDRVAADYLGAYDEALAKAGARVWTRRRALIAELAPKAERAFDAIGHAGAAHFGYAPQQLALDFSNADEEALATALRAALSARLRYDLDRGFTTVGPHADDLTIELEGRAAKSFGSQGQQRALVLSWKVAEIDNLRERLGTPPLLLLDDVSSELDPERNTHLMHHVGESGAQAILTTTDPTLVPKAAIGDQAHWYDVRSGTTNPHPR